MDMLESLLAQIDWVSFAGWAALLLQFSLAVGVILRVMLTRHPPGSAFAWIILTIILPYVGFALYILIGERPVGRWRAYRLKKMLARWESITNLQSEHSVELPASQRHKGLVRLAQRLGDIAMTSGSTLELLSNSDVALTRIIEDVRGARKNIYMEFYIWSEGGLADVVAKEIMCAARRGVDCRILIDALGSRAFLKSEWPQRMQKAGVHLLTALPMHFLSFSKGRADLRMHRKTVVIDDMVGYTGSLNMFDPRHFKQDEGVGEWVDAMVRVQGTAVADLKLVFCFDWALQPDDTGRQNEFLPTQPTAPKGQARVVVVPSGPTTVQDANQRLILEAINCARHRILITTPYFVPGEALALALQNAAYRGVDVRLCLPEKSDSHFVQWASRRYFDGLMSAGVKILAFHEGLLHTKAITVDDDFAVFGTVNMDNRSMHLNFEMMLLIFDSKFVKELISLQRSYEARSKLIDSAVWYRRPVRERLLEGFCYLLSPLL